MTEKHVVVLSYYGASEKSRSCCPVKDVMGVFILASRGVIGGHGVEQT